MRVFSKNKRFRQGKRLEEHLFALDDQLMLAAHTRSPMDSLQKADHLLDLLRFDSRLVHARNLTTLDQYHYAAGQMDELGRLLGGWIKSLTPHRNIPDVNADLR